MEDKDQEVTGSEPIELHTALKAILDEAKQRNMNVRYKAVGKEEPIHSVRIEIIRNSPAGLKKLNEVQEAVLSMNTLSPDEEIHYFRADVLDENRNPTRYEFVSFYVVKKIETSSENPDTTK